MLFRKETKNPCAIDSQRQKEQQQQQQSHVSDCLFQPEFMIFKQEDMEEEDLISLPFGWKITGRKRSIFEVETNIHTLGELYTTLVDLRNQLPAQLQQQQPEEPPLARRSSSFSCSEFYGTLSRSSSSHFSISSPLSLEEDSLYYNLLAVYPDFIFESLLELFLECCSCSQKRNLIDLHRVGKLNKSYSCAVFAYTALHASLCHSEKYGIYSFLNNLASDSYYTAHELIEFDQISVTTIETLVLMYQYLYLMGNETEGRNLFCLAWRQMQVILDEQPTSYLYRLLLWMAELDWTYSIAKCCDPIIDYHHVKKSVQLYQSSSLTYTALKFRMKGLNMILNHEQLNGWRTKYLQHFLYKRHSMESYCTEDKLALQLHALYFSGMLQFHQYRMMRALETLPAAYQENDNGWTDYFSRSNTHKAKTDVEKNLFSCMNAAYGFIQVVKLLLDEGDICQLPEMTDTLSAACTVLYFGNKVTTPTKSAQEALLFIVSTFSKSSMMQCPRVDRFVKTWSPVIIK